MSGADTLSIRDVWYRCMVQMSRKICPSKLAPVLMLGMFVPGTLPLLRPFRPPSLRLFGAPCQRDHHGPVSRRSP
eukprot:2340052-Rhodomonas_salina.4